MRNVSEPAGFLLSGLPGPRGLQRLQAGALAALYLAALLGNGLVLAVTSLDRRLHRPMYFFLRNLSLSDLCLVSAVVPKTIANSLRRRNSISLPACAAQVFLVPFSAASELFLLTAMAVDRYAAICHPLHYPVLMDAGSCARAAALSWLGGGVASAAHTAGTFSLSYCGPRELRQLFCDIPQLLAISCSKQVAAETVLVFVNAALDACCFLCIAASYVRVFSAVTRMPSAEGQAKAYATCLPHLAVVLLFLSTAFAAYLKPMLGSASPPTSSPDLVLSAVYVVLPPALNPVIYSLRNRAMLAGLEKLITGKLLTRENVLVFLHK